MGLTGFNAEEIRGSLNGIKNAYDGLMVQLCDTTQKDFVNEMGNYWACQDAVDFFAVFAQNFDNLIKETNRVYQSVFGSISSAASNWWLTTGERGTLNLPTFSERTYSMSVDQIKLEFSNKSKGIDEALAKSTVQRLEKIILPRIKNRLNDTYNSVATCGFLGHEQDTQLQTSLDQLAQKMGDVFEGQIKAVNTAIEKTVTNYGSYAQGVSGAFGGGQQ